MSTETREGQTVAEEERPEQGERTPEEERSEQEGQAAEEGSRESQEESLEEQEREELEGGEPLEDPAEEPEWAKRRRDARDEKAREAPPRADKRLKWKKRWQS